METLLQLDGAYGEGGGQIIRTALSLAAITGTAFALTRIRAGRSKPGLQPQHLTAVRLAADLCSAQVEGDAVGSVSLRFVPQAPVYPGSYTRDIGTAGAMALVMQTALVPLAHSGGPSMIRLTGGTHVAHAPTIDYLDTVYFPALRRMGLEAQVQTTRAGFYPRGGGEALVAISSAAIRPLALTARGKLRALTAIITTSGLPAHVAERGAAAVTRAIGKLGLGRQVTLTQRDLPSNGTGAAVVLAAECEQGHAGFVSLGARGKPMEQVAEDACRDFAAWWRTEAACDEHLADQLVLPLALAQGDSQWTTPTVTEHLRTVIWLVEQFLPVRFTLTALPTGAHLVQVGPR
jgi:RNA 3'-terminal phosphate cyclase (ATP)